MIRCISFETWQGQMFVVRAVVRGVWALHRTDAVVRCLDVRTNTSAVLRYIPGQTWTVSHVPSGGAAITRLDLPTAMSWWRRLCLEVPYMSAGVREPCAVGPLPEPLREELLHARPAADDFEALVYRIPKRAPATFVMAHW